MIKNRFLGLILSLAVICPSFISGMEDYRKKFNRGNLKYVIMQSVVMGGIGFGLGSFYFKDKTEAGLSDCLGSMSSHALKKSALLGLLCATGTAAFSTCDKWLGWGLKGYSNLRHFFFGKNKETKKLPVVKEKLSTVEEELLVDSYKEIGGLSSDSGSDSESYSCYEKYCYKSIRNNYSGSSKPIFNDLDCE